MLFLGLLEITKCYKLILIT